MLNTIEINPRTREILYITDEESTALELVGKKEAVLFVCKNPENAPFLKGIRYITDDVNSCDMDYFRLVYARQKKLSLKILETGRCIVRELTLSDLDDLYKIYEDPEIKKYLEPLYDYEKEKEFLSNYIENMYGMFGYGLWAVVDRESGKLIGRAGISIRSINGKDENELGYVLDNKYRKKGIAYEVSDAILKYAKEKLGMKKMHIVTSQNNTPSIALAEKLGFEYYDNAYINNENYKIFLKTLN